MGNMILVRFWVKASAHSCKRFTSPPFLSDIFLSLYAPIASDEYHAWFHLNSASPAAMKQKNSCS